MLVLGVTAAQVLAAAILAVVLIALIADDWDTIVQIGGMLVAGLIFCVVAFAVLWAFVTLVGAE
jgi:hypothetical protein